MTKLTPKAMSKLADAIELNSGQFGAIYDPLAAEHGGLRWMVLNLDPAPRPYLPALLQAEKLGWLDKLVEKLVEADSVPSLAELVKNDAGFKVELQGLVSAESAIVDSSDFNTGYIRASKRVCRIIVDRPGQAPVSGTGFLIAQQAVLTNWHVVKDLIQGGQQVNGSHKWLTAQFDFVGGAAPTDVAVAEKWLIGFSECNPAENPTGGTHAPQQHLDTFADTLDFAVIRLAQPVGRERSSYRLDPPVQARLNAPGNGVTLYQHPGATRLSHSPGMATALWPPAIETRLHHSASSIDGSSGGLLLNSDFLAVGLHQSEVKFDDGMTINAAIPLAKIATKFAVTELDGDAEPLLETMSGEAIVGRDDLLATLLAMAAGGQRILTLPAETFPEIVSGILASLFSSSDHQVASFHSAHLPSGPREFACELVDRLFPPGTGASELPDAADGNTAEAAWVKDVLVPPLLEKLRLGIGSKLLWLVVSGLEDGSVIGRPRGYVLEQLLGRIAALPFLRIVLVGQTGALSGIGSEWMQTRFARTPTVDDYVKYLQRYLVNADRDDISDAVMRASVNAGLALVAEPKERGMARFLPQSARQLAASPRGG